MFEKKSKRHFCVVVALSVGFFVPVGAQTVEASAGKDATSVGLVVVSGVVPDEATRQAILGRAREVYGRDRVVDRIGVAVSSMPPNWADYVKKLLTPDLKSVHRGHLKISGNTVELMGETESAATKEKIGANMMASLNPTYSVNNKLVIGEAPQARIDSILIDKIVEFESGSAVLTPVGRQVIDQLMPVLKGLNGKKVQVTGHTDGVGLRQANLLLSKNRAESVKSYLVANSLPATDILIVGMGPDQPLAGNETPEGRTKNRRIEFKVMP